MSDDDRRREQRPESVLSDSAVEDQLKTPTGWRRAGNAVGKEFMFGSGRGAVASGIRLALEAESADHHADILIRYTRVRLTDVTHAEDDITQEGFDGAQRADRCAP